MNYQKARDWEVLENAKKGYEEAIEEALRRGLDIKKSPICKGGYK